MNSSVSLTSKQNKVLQAVASRYSTPRNIVRATKIKGGTVRSALSRLKADGYIEADSASNYSVTSKYMFGPDKKPFADGISVGPTVARPRRKLSAGWILAAIVILIWGLLLWYL